MTDVYILRHGETQLDSNRSESRLKGSLDTEHTLLSDKGILEVCITGQAIGSYYSEGGESPLLYFAHSPLKRTTESDTIINAILQQIDSRHLPFDAGLEERHFGDLEGAVNADIDEAVRAYTPYLNYQHALFYSDKYGFLIEKLIEDGKLKGPLSDPGESFRDSAERAYKVAGSILDIVEKIDSSYKRSAIIITTHQIFGMFVYNAIRNLISEQHHPDFFEDRERMYHHALFEYADLKPCRFTRLDVRRNKDQKLVSILKESNDRGHLVGVEGPPFTGRHAELISWAKGILEREPNTQ